MTQAHSVGWSASAQRDLAKLSEKVATAVVEFIYGGLADNPHRVGHELTLQLAGLHSARRGDFRVLYGINDDEARVITVNIDHRADVYRRG